MTVVGRAFRRGRPHDPLIVDEGIDLLGARSSEFTIKARRMVLTDAQIKALPEASVEIVPAPGPNKIVFPIDAIVQTIFVEGGGYANISVPSQLGLVYPSGNAILWQMDVEASGIFEFAPSSFATILSPVAAPGIGTVLPEDAINQSLLFGANNINGPYTGGNPANTLAVTVFYAIVDL
jgi:hypothetical protein